MKDKIITFTFLFIIYGLFILNIILPKENISYDERRYLKDFPSLSMRKISNGKYFKDLDDYIVDNFAFRSVFRRINVFYNFNIINKNDYNGYYVLGDYTYKIDKLNYDKVISFTNKINNLDRYFDNSNVFFSVIPDKSYYMENNYSIDFDYLEKIILENINSNYRYIAISDELELDSYYYSDIHWRGDKLDKVVSRISEYLNIEKFDNLDKNTIDNFKGSYYGNVIGFSKLDKLVYLDNEIINSCSLDDGEGVYRLDKLKGLDFYDIYLGGNKALIKINNDMGEDRELIVFGDSFSRSIVPLLLKSYKNITIVDLRFIDSRELDNYIDFNNKDVLLLYSSTIINSSDIIK